ncbi:MAG: hypothetical protein QOF36_2449 [Microbacteriaceae bacterium]|jgi:hypothetical protein|nr:hypothetical protein [Microbacteriaceae bacterium]
MPHRIVRLALESVRDPIGFARKVHVKVLLARLRLRNRTSLAPVTGSTGVVVNLTTHGHRIDYVFYALESIARGRVRPSRLILWLDEEDILEHPPGTLRRLQSRGLEILRCPNYGPHNKQYPYAQTIDDERRPLVAADDDVLYPRGWLATLVKAAERHPRDIHAMRTHTVTFDGTAIAPYSRWVPGRGTEASYRNVGTGVSGVLYPPEFLAALRLEGERFLELAPRADDIWVHAVAVRHGFRARQVGERQAEYFAIPGTQKNTLYRQNVVLGGNDVQIQAAYGFGEVKRLLHDAPHDSGILEGITLDPAPLELSETREPRQVRRLAGPQ